MPTQLNIVTIHRSVIRYPSFAGGDREIIISAVGVSIACIFTLMNTMSIVMGICVSLFSFPVARMMYKADPLLKKVYQRYTTFGKYYHARATPFCKIPK